MNRLLTALTLLLTLALHGRAQVFPTAKPVKHEVRAAWVTLFHNMDWPRTRATNDSTRERQRQELRDLLDTFQQAGINTVLFQARVGACTAYPSAIEPWHKSLTGRENGNPGYDPLAFAVDECHRRGMEIQCWVAAIPVGAYHDIGARRLRERGFPMRRFSSGTYLDPSYGEVPAYLASVCREMTERYDIDGIHLDFIRYSELWPRAATTEEADRRRGYITAIVRRIGEEIKHVKPWVKLTCAPIGKHADLPRQSSGNWNARDRVYQDAQRWVADGLVDQLYPMMYYRSHDFWPFAADWLEHSNGRTVAVGLGTYLLNPRESRTWTAADVERQMSVCRLLGLGTAHFSAGDLAKNRQGILDYQLWHYATSPALVPPMTWAYADEVEAPADLVLQDGRLTWKGTTPYYNIYASDTWPVDISDTRNLIVSRYAGSSLTLTDRHGRVPRRYFAVTAMNRFGCESQAAQSHSRYASGRLLTCNGQTVVLPAHADSTLLYDIVTPGGQRLLTREKAANGMITVSGLSAGAYVLRTSADRHGRTLTVGAFMVRLP